MGEGADIGVLHDVLGLAVVAQDAARQPIEPAVVGLHDRAHGSLVARERAADQFGVAGAGGGDCGMGAWRMIGSTVTGYGGWMRQGEPRFPKIRIEKFRCGVSAAYELGQAAGGWL